MREKFSSLRPYFDDFRTDISRRMDDVFNSPYSSILPNTWDSWRERIVPTNFRELDNEYHLEVAVPGMQKEHVKVDLNENTLCISAERKVENTKETENYTRQEFSSSSYHRSYDLPENVSKKDIVAQVVDGILTITLPKTKVETKANRVEIKVD